jgi:hypothetical protein
MSATRGRIGDYAFWQWRDYALGPMIWTIIATFMIGVFPMIMLRLHTAEANIPEEQLNRMFGQGYGTMIGILAFMGSFLAVSRCVSRDRSPGLARFLFAKPIGVSRYYLQEWLVRAATVMAIAAITALLINQYIFPVRLLGAVGSVGTSLVLIGGVGFLLSVLTAQDTLLLIVVYLVPDMLDSLQNVFPGWKWLFNGLLTVMPPMHQLDDLRNALIQNTAVAQGTLWHVLLYGTGCIALAWYLVRRMPLVR